MAVNVKINNGTNIGQVKVSQPIRSTIVDQNFKPKPNVSLGELVDVSTGGVENGYTILFNTATNKYEVGPVSNVAVTISHIYGGTF